MMLENQFDVKSWQVVWSDKRFRTTLLLAIATLTSVLLFLPFFYGKIIGPRPGIYAWDPLMHKLHPMDWSVPVFTIIYLSILHSLFSLIRRPGWLVTGLAGYVILSVLRMISMYMITLEPPVDMILLKDPLTAIFYPGNGFAKDLFFSGHVSTLTLLVMLEKGKMARLLKMTGAVIVAIFLVWQHVHYTIDVIAGALTAMAVYDLLLRYLWRRTKS